MMEREGRPLRCAVVTGPTGAIGTALCRTLLAQGVTVYAVVRPGSPRGAALPQSLGQTPQQKLNLLPCDAAELDKLPELLQDKGAEKPDVFFHLAWAGTTGAGRNDMPAQIANIQNTVTAVRTAAALGCGVFVGAGSQAEYGRVPEGILRPDTPTNPETGYGCAKLCAGRMSRLEAKAVGVAHVWARVLSVYGPCDGPNSMVSVTIRRLLDGEKPALTTGEQLWDYLYADDAAAAFAAMARYGQDGAVYPVGSGTARPLRDYITELRDAVCERTAAAEPLPLGLGELPYAPQQVMRLQADLTALRTDCGFAPQTDFAAGIRTTIDWVRNKKA